MAKKNELKPGFDKDGINRNPDPGKKPKVITVEGKTYIATARKKR